METMTNEKKNKLMLWIFLASMTVFQIIFVISLAVSHGYAMEGVTFYYFMDSYMDYFNVQSWSLQDNPYSNMYCVYAPLCVLFYRFTTIFTKAEVYDYVPQMYSHFSEATYNVMLFNIFTAVVLALIIFSIKKGNTTIKMWFTILILMSTPFTFLYERGNVLLIAVTTLLLFILGYDSDKKWVRELSYIALAISAVFKIYPAVFGFLILKKKRIAEAFHCLIYGLALFILPAFAYDGFDTFRQMFENLSKVNESYKGLGIGYRIDIKSGIDALSLSLGNGLMEAGPLKTTLWAILILGLAICAIISKSKWRTVLALTLIAITSTGYSWNYNLTFLCIPLILLLDSDEERTSGDFIYLILMIFTMAPLAFQDCIVSLDGNQGYEVYLYSYVATISTILMVIILVLETLTSPLKKIELDPKKRELQQEQESISNTKAKVEHKNESAQNNNNASDINNDTRKASNDKSENNKKQTSITKNTREKMKDIPLDDEED